MPGAHAPRSAASTANPSNSGARSRREATRRVFLVRHGRTRLNASGRLRGWEDVPLDSVGRQEAAAAAAALATTGLRRAVSSPLARARQTADAIARPHGLVVETDDGLLDRDYGWWAGHPVDELVHRFGTVENAPGIEPAASFEQRVLAAFDRVAGTASPTPVLVVAHDAVNRTILSNVVAALPDDPEAIAQRTGCVNVLELSGDRWRALIVNAVAGDDLLRTLRLIQRGG
jgi:broad specificity phosphatase PhoE